MGKENIAQMAELIKGVNMFVSGFEKKKFIKKREGGYGRVITGKNAQLAWVRFDPCQCTDHEHINEQLGYILSGNLKITIGGKSEILGPGDAYFMPPNIKHGFEVLGDKEAEYFEIFSPPQTRKCNIKYYG